MIHSKRGAVRIRPLKALFGLLIAAALAAPALAQIPEPPDGEEMLSDVYKGKTYSPYARRGFPSRPLWGDTHLHTAMSFDAGAFGNRLGIAEAYRFARGEEITSTTGLPVKLSRPLDFLVVADHSDNMGFFPDLLAGAPNILSDPKGREYYQRIQAGEGVDVALELIAMFSQSKLPPSLVYGPDTRPYKSAWRKTVETAEEYNDPGRFTALIGFEWTSLVNGDNLHRVVIFRDGAGKALQMAPFTTLKPQGSNDPLDLYKWLSNYEKATGGDVLAISHNGNLSNGVMFPVEAQYTGRKLDRHYVTLRNRWEPVYEATQIKGDGETHPLLSPEDEFADYETWDFGNLDLSELKTPEMLPYEYARSALKSGLMLEERLGTNPYKFGMIGSTDSHTSLSTAGEDNFFGKHSGVEPSPVRMKHEVAKFGETVIHAWQMTASGRAAVWAAENTRESIFDAMERKEVYATTGPRMLVRFFGGWNFSEGDLNSRSPAFAGYEKGVPMGADLPARPERAKAPVFMVYALRDPIGANLDRIQIIKGWLDAGGKPRERVYDVALSGGRRPDAKGKAPPVGNTVDPKTANFTNTIGAPELGAVWADPDFDPSQRAFYYARVIEIPSPRWSTYEAVRYGVDIPKGAPVSTQERAYTSPIWYTPRPQAGAPEAAPEPARKQGTGRAPRQNKTGPDGRRPR